jgi:hypothetical protein
MNALSFIVESFNAFFPLFGWRDALEIVLIAWCIYTVSVWLKKDKHNNLLGYFYAYMLFMLGAHALVLPCITTMLWLLAPICVVFFFMIHQHTLQKNFIALTNHTLKSAPRAEWLDVVIKSALVAVNNNQELLAVIEHTDNLETLLTSTIPLKAEITEEFFALLLHSESFNQQQFIWLTTKGTLRGINSYWHNSDASWATSCLEKTPDWQQEALLRTTHNDAIVVHIAPATRMFTIIIKGKIYEQINAHSTLQLIKKYINTPQSSDWQGEKYYGAKTKKHSVSQHNS